MLISTGDLLYIRERRRQRVLPLALGGKPWAASFTVSHGRSAPPAKGSASGATLPDQGSRAAWYRLETCAVLRAMPIYRGMDDDFERTDTRHADATKSTCRTHH